MKLGKLSLVAVMALGTSAFAIENVKVSGDVKIIYQTTFLIFSASRRFQGTPTTNGMKNSLSTDDSYQWLARKINLTANGVLRFCPVTT